MKEKERRILPTGKLDLKLLQEIFKEYNSPQLLNNLNNSTFKKNYEDSKERVKLGFAIGEDAAVLSMENSDKYIVAKTDPITFATQDIGYYVVNVNANDVAAMGATPKWFQATILLPAGIATEEMAKKICVDIQKACLDIGVLLIGGHTEVTHDLTRPIVVGSMIGEVKREHYVQSSGGKPGDAIILTKGIPLEGTSIIAREKESELLEKGISHKEILKAKQLLFSPGISVIKEALLAVSHFNVHSMHDPTEGGIAMGLVELSKASNCGFHVHYESIPIVPVGHTLCEIYKLDPLRTLSSGSLLIVVHNADCEALLKKLHEKKIIASKIGELTKKKEYLLTCQNTTKKMVFSEKDEITKIFHNNK